MSSSFIRFFIRTLWVSCGVLIGFLNFDRDVLVFFKDFLVLSSAISRICSSWFLRTSGIVFSLGLSFWAFLALF